MHCARGTTLNDGTLNLQWKTPGGRVELVQQFDMMDEGTHLRTAEGQRNLTPTWHQADVLAVIVDHLEDNSKVVIDGEALPEGSSWCAEVLPQFVSVVVGSGPLTAFGPQGGIHSDAQVMATPFGFPADEACGLLAVAQLG